MGVVDNVKAAIEIVQKADNLDRYRRLLDLQREVGELEEENRSLRAREIVQIWTNIGHLRLLVVAYVDGNGCAAGYPPTEAGRTEAVR